MAVAMILCINYILGCKGGDIILLADNSGKIVSPIPSRFVSVSMYFRELTEIVISPDKITERKNTSKKIPERLNICFFNPSLNKRKYSILLPPFTKKEKAANRLFGFLLLLNLLCHHRGAI